jgi:hypothetical protein
MSILKSSHKSNLIYTLRACILGSESHLVPLEKLDGMRRDISDLEVATITGASIIVPQDKPREFEEAVQVFL